MSKEEHVVIVGAGLCGTLLALRLAQRNIAVDLFEKRPDPRQTEAVGGRSINLALSDRGLLALQRVGLREAVETLCIPMIGRMIHPIDGSPFLSRYSARPNEYINSVSRAALNEMLLNEADRYEHVRVYFNHMCTDINIESGEAVFRNTVDNEIITVAGAAIFGTDGAGSVVREQFRRQTRKLLFNYSQDFLRHGYKELTIPPGHNGAFRIEKNALHIWPRGEFMVIALPNLDSSFTVTMFHPYKGKAGFDTLDSSDKLQLFFEEYYPNLWQHMPDYHDEYQSNPTGMLGTIKCYPWQAEGKVCLLGDAAHAIVPFYGQGMNASFEDVRVMDDVLNEYGTEWKIVFEEFQNRRKDNTDAIADLALDNFIEMRDKVDDPEFIRKRDIERVLESTYPEYYSKYSMVTFKPDLDYKEAMVQGRLQDTILLDLCRQYNGDLPGHEEVYKILLERMTKANEV